MKRSYHSGILFSTRFFPGRELCADTVDLPAGGVPRSGRIAAAGLSCLGHLILPGYMIGPSVLYEFRSGLLERKGHAAPDALAPDIQDPSEVAGSRPGIRFAASIPPSMGSAMTSLCRMGSSSRIGSLQSVLSWFSQVLQIVTCSHPSPQSGGKHFPARSIRLVMIWNFRSVLSRIMSQHPGRHSSASSRKKSEVIQV